MSELIKWHFRFCSFDFIIFWFSDLLQASEDLLKEHYADLSSKPFYAGLCKYMSSGPVVPMVWEGLNVVKTGRVMLGETNPKDSAPGTIRGDFCVQVIVLWCGSLNLSKLPSLQNCLPYNRLVGLFKLSCEKKLNLYANTEKQN